MPNFITEDMIEQAILDKLDAAPYNYWLCHNKWLIFNEK